MRLDDIVGGRWTVLHTGPHRRPAWRTRWRPHRQVTPPNDPAPTASSTARIADPLAATQEGASVVVVRPDGFVYAAADTDSHCPPPPPDSRPTELESRMTTAELTERTVRVNGKDDLRRRHRHRSGRGLLHGGGPGASGVSNYSRNIDALAQHFRVIVPDMPGYGRSAKGVDHDDPFGYLADTSADCSTNSASTGPTWSATPTAARARCGWPWTPRTGSTSSC